MTKREAIAEVRALANVVIEQAERKAKGWDKGAYRDDALHGEPTIKGHIRDCVAQAFHLSRQFQ